MTTFGFGAGAWAHAGVAASAPAPAISRRRTIPAMLVSWVESRWGDESTIGPRLPVRGKGGASRSGTHGGRGLQLCGTQAAFPVAQPVQEALPGRAGGAAEGVGHDRAALAERQGGAGGGV